MGAFARRAAPKTLPEIMDGVTDPDTLRAALSHLASVNRLSLGYRPTLAFVARLAQRVAHRPLRILDIGSGYGDTLRRLDAFVAARGIEAELTGVDLNPVTVALAEAECARHGTHAPIRFEVGDARAFGGEADAIVSSLFMHHLEDEEIIAMLRWLDRAPAFFVNDLYRSRFAAAGFRALATVSARHPIVRHDGPVSFARAFRRADWARYLEAAGVRGARIGIDAPFRLCVEKLP